MVDAEAHFEKGRLARLVVDLYARGDSGSLRLADFSALLKTSEETLTQNLEDKRPQLRLDKNQPTAKIWYGRVAKFTLESSATTTRAEFARLILVPPRPWQKEIENTALAGGGYNVFAARQHVKNDFARTGDVWLTDVPMVDQGEKGYCAVACVERVLRYSSGPVT